MPTAMASGEPGPANLPAASEDGSPGTAMTVGVDANCPVPVPNRIVTDLVLLLATAMSRLPSPLKSPVINATGVLPIAHDATEPFESLVCWQVPVFGSNTKI